MGSPVDVSLFVLVFYQYERAGDEQICVRVLDKGQGMSKFVSGFWIKGR